MRRDRDIMLALHAEKLGLAGLPVLPAWKDAWWRVTKGKKALTAEGQQAIDSVRKRKTRKRKQDKK